MPERINPYIAGAPVTDPTMFFGREDVFAWIEQNVSGRYADNALVIHGQRRVGKTSVLKQLARHLPDRYVPVFFDLQGRTHTTIDQFLWRLAREIARTLRSRRAIEVPKPQQEDFGRDPEHFAGPFLDTVRGALADSSLLIVFDEFDTLEEPTAAEMLGKDLIPYFSRMMHGAESIDFIYCIGSSGHKLEHMRAEYTDFFRTALYKKISFLEPHEARRLITEPVRDLMEYTPAAVERILTTASGHPYFTQLTCHELFATCQRTGDWRVDAEQVEAVLPDVIERGTVNLKFVWDEADDTERYALAALALIGEPSSKEAVLATLREHKVRISEEEIATALLALTARDVLAGQSGFTVDLLRLWLLQNRPMERVVDELAEKHPIAIRFSQIAEEYHEQGLLDQALESYRRALEAAPDYEPARLGAAEIHLEAKRWQEAAVAYQSVLEMDEENVQARIGLSEAFLALGNAAHQAGDTAAALDRYRQILQIHDEHTEARERLATLYLAQAERLAGQRRWEQAAEAISQAWAVIPEDVAREEQRVMPTPADLSVAGQLAQVLAPLRQALAAMRAQLAREIVARAVQLRMRKRFEAAITLLERARDYVADPAEIQREVEATREAERAEGPDKMLDAAERALRAERWGEAIIVLERLLTLEPGHSQAQEMLAQARQQQALAQMYGTASRALEAGRYGQAVMLLKRILGRQAGYRDAEQLLRQATAERGRQRRRGCLWVGAAGAIVALVGLVGLAWWLSRPDSPLMIALASDTPTPTSTPTVTPTPTETPTPTPTPSPEWQRLYDGRDFQLDDIQAIVVDPQDADVIYVGGYDSGVFKSVDGGASWQPAHTGLAPAGIRAMAIDPQDSQTLYAVTADGAVYRTGDGALTWQKKSQDDLGDLEIVAVDPYDSQHLYVAGETRNYDHDIYESWDGGESFLLSGTFDSIVDLDVDPQDSERLYVVAKLEGQDDLRVYRSNGAGAGWEEIWRREDEEAQDAEVLTIAPGDLPTIYLSDGDKVYRSRNGGDTWTTMGEEMCWSLLADPRDDETLYCWNWVYLKISHDGGASWGESVPYGIDTLALPAEGTAVYAVSGGLVVTYDEFETWDVLNAGLGNARLDLRVDPYRPATLYAIEGNGWSSSGFYRSSDAGESWEEITTPDGAIELAIVPTDGTMFRIDDFDEKIYRSVDGGSTWITMTVPGGWNDGIFVHPNEPDALYLLSGYQDTYVSTDGGVSWARHPGDWPTGWRTYFDASGETIYLISPGASGVERSSDGGERWVECGLTSWPVAALAIDPTDGDHVLAATEGGGVWVSTDGCRIWEPRNDGLENLFVNAIVLDLTDPARVTIGTDGGAHFSRDGGESWERVDGGLMGSGVIYDVIIDPDEPAVVYAATPLGIFSLEAP